MEAFIIVFLQSSDAHQSFLSYLQNNRLIAEAHRVSGEGCYWTKVRAESHDELNSFLDELLSFGNYKVSLSLTQVK
ncbi:Lrp/AsnC ligand binding domain-containing protein [Paenibacillus harenae]|uniref:DNA-binding Lrp family transcriptional regulator n=1 Tax=Paenibacillus harenae TaxID=306543 RepID=A0ABT9U2L7_PAEHA|nr:Lrp/AsnC ligand binding domain-containing protein [Paenibacillus harenae]MDQ0113870.1 DNA-binding Lrp family transcriptional regulator [Paenibacillus harenae]